MLHRTMVVPNNELCKGQPRANGWTWIIELGSRRGKGGFCIECRIKSEWRYDTKRSAGISLNRWMDRLGIETSDG